MKELSQIRMAVLDALRGPGFRLWRCSLRSRPWRTAAWLRRWVSARPAEKTAGFCHYLGEMKDPETQAVLGTLRQGAVRADHRGTAGESGGGLRTRLRNGHRGAAGRASGGVRTGELTWEAICWEKTTGMFLRRGVLECRALFLAESAVESGEFLDFRLKGVMSE